MIAVNKYFKRQDLINELMAASPVEISKISKDDIDKEILRTGIIAELDAISLYEQLSSLTTKEDIRSVLLDIAKEEKTHVGEFQALLNKYDPDHADELKSGEKEVKQL